MWDTLIECDTVKNCRILLADINNQDQFFYRKFSSDELFYIILLFQLTRLRQEPLGNTCNHVISKEIREEIFQ